MATIEATRGLNNIAATPDIVPVDWESALTRLEQIPPRIVQVSLLPLEGVQGIDHGYGRIVSLVYRVQNVEDGRVVDIGGNTGLLVSCLQHSSPANPKMTTRLREDTGYQEVGDLVRAANNRLSDAGLEIKALHDSKTLAQLAYKGIEQGYWLQLDEATRKRKEALLQETDEAKKIRRADISELIAQMGHRFVYKKTRNDQPNAIRAFCAAYIAGESLTMEQLSYALGGSWGTDKDYKRAYSAYRSAKREAFQPYGWDINPFYQLSEKDGHPVQQRYRLLKLASSPDGVFNSALGEPGERSCFSKFSAALIVSILAMRQHVPVYSGDQKLFDFNLGEGTSLCPRMQEAVSAAIINQGGLLPDEVFGEACQIAVGRLETLLKRRKRGANISDCLEKSDPQLCLVTRLLPLYKHYGNAFLQALRTPVTTRSTLEQVARKGASVVGAFTREIRLPVDKEVVKRVSSTNHSKTNPVKPVRSVVIKENPDLVEINRLKEQLKKVKREEKLAIEERKEINEQQGLYYDPRWLTLVGLKRVMIERALNSLGAGK